MLTLRSLGMTAAAALTSLAMLALPGAILAQGQTAPRRVRRAPSVRSLPAPRSAPLATTLTPRTSGPEPSLPAPRLRPPSLLNDPPQPASVEFHGKLLSIRAQNSSLNAILLEVASKSGMKIEGLGRDERVFGNFGPGAAHDILADLLNGTPYGVLMVGTLSNGAPKQMILSPASSGPPSGSQAVAIPPPTGSYRDEPAGGSASLPQPSAQPVQTPQELFRELQVIRERQQQMGQRR